MREEGKEGLPPQGAGPAGLMRVRIPADDYNEARDRGIKIGLTFSSSLAIQNAIKTELWKLLERYGINPFMPMDFQYQNFDCSWTVVGVPIAVLSGPEPKGEGT